MSALYAFFKKRQHILILFFILLIGLFFRIYKVVDRLEYAADGDLSSWIVKDIVVNGHFRLIGQLTTAPGIFIGGAYYYLITPFYMLFNMDPIGATIPITIIGMLTVLSYYFVFSKLFNIKVGLIAAFLYAVLLSLVQLDRRVVPSTPTNLWVIWYFYTVVNISRGKYFVLPILGILIGLIWHIHIAMLPALIAIPAAFIVSRKIPAKGDILKFLFILFITSLPLIIFELRHHFQQTLALVNNFSIKSEGAATGLYKFKLVIEMLTKNINTLFFMPQSFQVTNNFLFVVLILSSAFILIKKKFLSLKEIIPLYVWFAGAIAFFSLSSSPISEYYFANTEVIFLGLASLLLFYLYKSSIAGKVLVLLILGVVLIKNSYFTTTSYYYHKGYKEKKAVVDYIIKDSKRNGFPCFGITYITTPGENVGFRYFFYLANQKLIHPSLEVPVYNIVIPDELSLGEVKQKFGHIGVIPPTFIPPKETIEKTCQGPNTNLTDPMFGYVE